MAISISPLALGIGLQGKYDYRSKALLEANREKGKAKAAADAEAAKEKKRAEYRKMVSNITPKGLLPTQAKEIENDVLDAISSLEGEINGPELMMKVHSIKAKQAAFEQDAKAVQGALRSSYFEGDRDSGQLIYSSENPEDVDAVNFIPGTNILYNKATNRYSVGNAKYKNTSTIIDEGLAKGGLTYYDLTIDDEVVGINGRKTVIRKIKPEISDMMLNDALTGSNLQSSNNDYYVYLKSKRQEIPDRRTDEGKAAFDEGRDAFLRKQIEDEVNNRMSTLGMNKPAGTNVTVYNAAAAADDSPVDVYEPSQILNRKNGLIQTYEGLPVMDDNKLTLPTTNKIWRTDNNKKFKKGKTFEATYGKPGLVSVATQDYRIPAQKYTMPDGTTIDLEEMDVTAGQPLEIGYDEFMAEKGKAKADYVIWGVYTDPSTRAEISIVRPLSDMGVSQAYSASNNQSKKVAYYNKQGKENKEKRNAEIKTKYKGSAPAANNNPAPPANKKKDAAPAPAPTPKPKGGSTSTRRTAEADAAKNALKAKLDKGKKK